MCALYSTLCNQVACVAALRQRQVNSYFPPSDRRLTRVQQGFSATIFERDPSISSRNIRDWTILIHWGLPPLLALLPPPVAAKLPGAICNPTLDFSADGVETLPCFNGLTGERLFASPTPGARRFNRQRLRRVLLGVDGDGGEVAEGGLDVRWGKRLVALEATDDGDGPVTLLFADGDTFEADYVLGADGPNSTVRELLFAGGGSDDAAAAAKAVGSGFMIASCCPRYRDAEKARFIEAAHPVAAIMMGPSVVGGCGRECKRLLFSCGPPSHSRSHDPR